MSDSELLYPLGFLPSRSVKLAVRLTTNASFLKVMDLEEWMDVVDGGFCGKMARKKSVIKQNELGGFPSTGIHWVND